MGFHSEKKGVKTCLVEKDKVEKDEVEEDKENVQGVAVDSEAQSVEPAVVEAAWAAWAVNLEELAFVLNVVPKQPMNEASLASRSPVLSVAIAWSGKEIESMVMENDEMIISIASGKGGTGKTTLATNLAVALGESVQFLDCDVEEPNAHLFLKPEISQHEEFYLEVPEINQEKCSLCGQCQDICQFNAIAILPELALTFPELCHSCGGCFMVCPEEAVSSAQRLLGSIEIGKRGPIRFIHGRLRVGEAMAPPLIKRVRQKAQENGITIVDAPPGTSCPVIAALRNSDYVILVTEPTPFGLNDLELAVGAVRALGLPMGIVINRSDLGDERVHYFAARESIPLLMEIPFDRQVAKSYARGELLVEALPHWRNKMLDLFSAIQKQLRKFRELSANGLT
jgi:MinD superfamily P-loop ATPase